MFKLTAKLSGKSEPCGQQVKTEGQCLILTYGEEKMKIIQFVPGKKAAINEEERTLDLKW